MAKSAGLGSETILKAALEGLEAQKGRVEEQILEVRRQLGLGSGRRGRPPGTKNAAAGGKRRKRHKISPEGRARIAAAARARWAALRKAKGTADAPATGKKRGRKKRK
jgi:hypothetical protein